MRVEHVDGALVVGAGPAGLMAADVLSAAGMPVLIAEGKPTPARKFLMAGVSGLNISHNEPFEKFLARYGESAARLKGALRAFDAQATRAFCASLGQETFVGPSGRIFPRAMKGAPLLRAWLSRLQGQGARLQTRLRMVGFDGAPIFEDAGGRLRISADVIILALGGASWPRLGADGAWTHWLMARGFALAPFAPANSALLKSWPDDFIARFDGAPVKNLNLRFDGAQARGDLMIVRRGLEGGPAYALSAHLRRALEAGRPATLSIDFKPDLDLEALRARFAKLRPKDSLNNGLRKIGLSPVQIGLLRLCDGARPTDALERARWIKTARLPIDGVEGLQRAISSSGGLSWRELDADFMALRQPGLFFAGEMIDWDAPTGGYLLQACLATGAAAAHGALKWRKKGLVDKNQTGG
jgi:hypothetical protein